LGLGSLFSHFEVFQIAPTVSWNVTDRLSIGFGPTLDLANLRVDPLLITSPNASGDYPVGTHTRYAWGGGVQAGVYYLLGDAWHIGASVKSPQWFEDFHFNTAGDGGRPR